MNSRARNTSGGFTLIEIIVSIGVFALVFLGATAAIGQMMSLERTAYQRTVASSFAMMIGQWRAATFAAGCYLDPSATPTQYTNWTNGRTTYSIDLWGNSGYNKLLKKISATAVPYSTGDYTVFQGGTAADHPSSGVTWFLSAATTSDSSSQYDLTSYQDLLVCLSNPSPSVERDNGRYRMMTIWQVVRAEFDDVLVINRRAIFLGRYLIADDFQ